MGSATHTPYSELDFAVGDPFPLPGVIDERELDRLAAPRSIAGRSGQAGWSLTVIQGGRRSGRGEAETGEVRSDPHSGRRRVIRALALVRIGLAAAIMTALLVAFAMPRAGADRGPVPAVSHLVQPGDSLWSVAEQYTPPTGDVRATVALIRSANEGLSPFLAVGDVIEVPVGEIPGAPSGGSG